MKKFIVLFLIAIGMSSASAGEYIAIGATPTKMTNTSSNLPEFAVYATGGSGGCLGVWIVFPLSAAPDADTHKRAYAAALLALTTGLKVTIHNYNGASCNSASYIEINAS